MASSSSVTSQPKLHRVVSTTSKVRNNSEETFLSQNTIFSSVKGNVDDVFDDKMKWEFNKFCFGFSMSASMTVLAVFYSPILTSVTIGGSGSGTFFVAFALCSVGGAKYVVNFMGVKKAILLGHFGSSLFVSTFLVMTQFLQDRVQFYINIIICIAGGGAQAVMWTGLGKYTLMMSNLLIPSMDTEVVRDMNRKLINNFALFYTFNLIFGFMVALILAYVSVLFQEDTRVIFTIPFQLCYVLVSSYLLWKMDSLNDVGDLRQPLYFSFRGLRDMIESVCNMERISRIKLLLLLPYHIAWGMTTAFWILYLVSNVFHEEISFLAAAYGLFLSYLFSMIYSVMVKVICPRLNHNFHIVVGGLSGFCLGVSALSIDGFTRHETREDYRVVVVFSLLYGIGMSVYDNIMRAEVANLLQHYEVLAYSVTGFAKSAFAGVCLITSTIVLQDREDGGRLGLELEIMIASLIGVIAFICAALVDGDNDSMGQLEEKLMRDNERNSVLSDIESLYHNHISLKHTSSITSKQQVDALSVHSGVLSGHQIDALSFQSGLMLQDGSMIDDQERLSRISSTVDDDSYYVPDYF